MTSGRAPTTWQDGATLAGLVAAVVVVYGAAISFDFVGCDDPDYVTTNVHVMNGLSLDGVRWAFTAFDQGNWHPLTWLSHMLDATLFPKDMPGQAGWHHLTNLLLHAANTVLLFLVLKRLTQAHWPSAMVAALFALHPLHVESVAWVAERKDVLSTFLGLLALAAYARYVERPSVSRYLPIFFLLALSLMAKPMLVTLPFVMLLLDYWPLGRLGRGRPIRLPVLEKLPLLVLAAASSVVTFFAQQSSGAVMGLQECPFSLRLGNAMFSYVMYLWNMVWPQDLALLYAFPFNLPLWYALASAAAVVAVTALVIWQARRRPYLAVGWFWYLGTLVPVIGLVQIGAQARADRYTYLPLVGIFIMVAWEAADILAFWRRRWMVLAPAAIAVLAACGWLASRQVAVWADTGTLFRHAIDSGAESALAHDSLGDFLSKKGDWEGAIAEYGKAVKWNAKFAGAWYNMGTLWLDHGRNAQALEAFKRFTELEPERPEGHASAGLALVHLGRPAEAADELAEAARLAPKDPKIRMNFALALHGAGRLPEAVREYSNVLEMDPSHASTHLTMGVALVALGRTGEALVHIRAAVQQTAQTPETLSKLAWTLINAPAVTPESAAEAVHLAEVAVELSRRQDPVDLATLAAAYAAAGQAGKAAQTAREGADLAETQGRPDVAAAIRERLKLYEAGTPAGASAKEGTSPRQGPTTP